MISAAVTHAWTAAQAQLARMICAWLTSAGHDMTCFIVCNPAPLLAGTVVTDVSDMHAHRMSLATRLQYSAPCKVHRARHRTHASVRRRPGHVGRRQVSPGRFLAAPHQVPVPGADLWDQPGSGVQLGAGQGGPVHEASPVCRYAWDHDESEVAASYSGLRGPDQAVGTVHKLSCMLRVLSCVHDRVCRTHCLWLLSTRQSCLTGSLCA